MTIYRLLGIVTYLLNHGMTSSAKLAELFEVSRRTIVRDIERLSMAGIPVNSQSGANGGYSIIEGWKLDGQIVSPDDQASIVLALKTLSSVHGGKRFDTALEKVLALLPEKKPEKLFLDFSAASENDAILVRIRLFEQAISNKKVTRIAYTDASGLESVRSVEPLALSYRWYAWYLLAYCLQRQDYRVFKLVRIHKLETTSKQFTIEHGDVNELLENTFSFNSHPMDIVLKCKAKVRAQVMEYLGDEIAEEYDNGDFTLKMRGWENERTWFGMLFSFGDDIEVLEPEMLKNRLLSTTKKIISLYE